MVEYLDEVTSRELFYTVLAPQIIITFPLTILCIVIRNTFIYAQLILHIASSIPDLINSLRYVTVFRDHKFRLCREGKKIVGYIAIKPSGECTLYTL